MQQYCRPANIDSLCTGLMLPQVTQTIDPLGQTVENRVELQAPLRWARLRVD